MNQLQEYIAIIHNRQQNPLPEGQYGEKHHIIPRSCGGPNRKWNVVRLTPEEHYRCHKLLPEIYTTGKEHGSMVRAWGMMAFTRDNIPISEEEYGDSKRQFSKAMSDVMLGSTPWNKGMKMPDETRQKISEIQKGKPKTEEFKSAVSATMLEKFKETQHWMIGKHHSDETRKKMSEARKGKPQPWMHEDRRGEGNFFYGKHHTEETKKKNADWHRGRKASPETRRKMSEAQKARQERLRQERKAMA